MRLHLAQRIDRALPASLSEEERVHAHFFLQAWLLTVPFALASIALFSATGVWGQVWLNVTVLILGPFIVWRFLADGRLRLWTHVSLGLITLAFGLAMLTQEPVDATNAAFMVVVPLSASFVLGPRAALPWVVIPAVWAIVVLKAASLGYILHNPDPTPVLSSSINIVMMLAMVWLFALRFSDVREQALARAHAADRAKSTFLATVSHEIRTPMNGVLGMTEVLLAEDLTADQREKLGVIQRSGHLLVSLIDDLLDLTKIEAGHLAIEIEPFDLVALLDDLFALYEPQVKSKGLTLEVQLPPGTPSMLVGDGLRLRQVLGNLLSNAIKFTETGKVSVAIEPLENRDGQQTLRFVVHDTGIGIPAEILPRLFVAFQQGDASTTRRFGGTGLGLVLCRQLVTLMGGTLECTSAVGQGSRFTAVLTFTLAAAPRAHASPASPRPHPQAQAQPQLQLQLQSPSQSDAASLPVLVVDDNAINLRVAAALVGKVGFLVVTASSGREALEAMARQPFAAVLMDCHMPEMDGFEAAERIRELERAGPRTPIIALTASTSVENREACRRSGMLEMLPKPLSLAELAEVLGRVPLRTAAPPASGARVA